MVDSLVRGGFEANESVSPLLEASCLTAYISVLCWEMVETTPLLMDLTLEGQDEKFRCLYYVFSWSFGCWIQLDAHVLKTYNFVVVLVGN